MTRLAIHCLSFAVLLSGSERALAATDPASPPAFGEQLMQVLGGLVMVLLLVGVLAWLAKRLNGSRFSGGRNLRLVAGLSLGARERILVVEVGDTQLVVGVAPGRVQTLHVLDRPLAEADGNPGTVDGGSFAARLSRLTGEGRSS